ncbi:unnamed protein product, partial [Iphiclides podalirius]
MPLVSQVCFNVRPVPVVRMSKGANENAASPGSTSEGRFPKIILFIIVAEFCERISYSGMRVFFTLYLRNKLDYTDDEATELYHIFNGLVYLCPIFGGIVADSYLGKYRTILYMMFVYLFGNSLVALTAIPHLMLPGRLCTLLGVFMITIGTGGIKPCVTAFGGEQFILPQQERLLSLYFSVLYFNLCVGSLIAKTLAPIFRSHVHCFGDKDCYSLAFGAPVIVIIISIVSVISDIKNLSFEIPPLSYVSNKRIAVADKENVTLTFDCDCFDSRAEVVLMEENKAISLYVTGKDIYQYEDDVDKSKSGFPMVRFLLTDDIDVHGLILYNKLTKNEEVSLSQSLLSERFEVYSSTYSVIVGNQIVMDDVKFENGGVYTLIIANDSESYIANMITVTEANSISMFLLVPQFVIVSMAEVFFAVTGNEFAFKESPECMKAVITAIWLLTEAFGNVLIILFTRWWINISQVWPNFRTIIK